MKKSGDEVIDDLYGIIVDSGLADYIDGELYRDASLRPADSALEDAVITFVTGTDGKIQEGQARVDIYVPDVDNGSGVMVKNIDRTRAISREACEVFDNLAGGEYVLRTGNMIQTESLEEAGRHIIKIDLLFKRTTF